MSALMTVGLPHFLALSVILFVLGLFTVATRRHGLAALMGIAIMLGAALLALVAFVHLGDAPRQGDVLAGFALLLAVAGAGVTLAILRASLAQCRSIDTERVSTLRD